MDGRAGVQPDDRRGRTAAMLGERYTAHHHERRADGDFVFVVERIPHFQRAIGRGKRVLDLGCRSGALTVHYVEGNQVVGVDVDEVALAKAAARGIEPVLADAEDPLPFSEGSFDAVVAGELLEHVRFPEALLDEIRRVLRSGGVLVGSVPNAYRLKSRLDFLRGRSPEKDPTHLHMFSPDALDGLLTGFEQVELAFVGGRFCRLHPRLLARDIVFTGVRPRSPVARRMRAA